MPASRPDLADVMEGGRVESKLDKCFLCVQEAEAAIAAVRACLVEVHDSAPSSHGEHERVRSSVVSLPRRASFSDWEGLAVPLPVSQPRSTFDNSTLRNSRPHSHGCDVTKKRSSDSPRRASRAKEDRILFLEAPMGAQEDDRLYDNVLLEHLTTKRRFSQIINSSVQQELEDKVKQDMDNVSAVETFAWRRTCRCMMVPILNPESAVRIWWLVLGLCFIVYEAFAIPVFLSFDLEPQAFAWWFTLFTNVYFMVDIPAAFFTGYHNHHGVLELDPGRIARAYMRTWLFLDLVASIPWEWLPLESDSEAVMGGTKGARFFRLARMFRMLRLLRLMKLWKALEFLEQYLESRRAAVFLSAMLRLLGIIAIIVHWSACLWHIVGNNSDPNNNWIMAKIGIDSSVQTRYAWSLYFTFTTMSTVGFGDVTPQNMFEIHFTILFLCISALVFSTLLGVLTDLVSNLRKQVRERSEARMQLARYMKWRDLPRAVASRIRQYMLFHFDQQTEFGHYEEDLKAQLPPVLRLELSAHVSGQILHDAPFLAWMSNFSLCIKRLSGLVRVQFFEAGDFLFKLGELNNRVTILLEGIVRISLNDYVHDDFEGVPQRRQLANIILNNAGMIVKALLSRQQKKTLAASSKKENVARPIAPTSAHMPWMVAKERLETMDAQRAKAAKVLQQYFKRKKMRGIVKNAIAHAKTSWSMVERLRAMPSVNISAPAYFGESCLWKPLEKWDHEEAASYYVYSARCQGRGKMMLVEMESIHEVIDAFSPWLGERFEQFRHAIIESSDELMTAPHLRQSTESMQAPLLRSKSPASAATVKLSPETEHQMKAVVPPPGDGNVSTLAPPGCVSEGSKST